MIFLADLHVHSHYSRATSRNSNLIELARWGAIKGLRVIATGDFTHPAWRGEIHEMLQEAEPGLFKLKPEFTAPDTEGLAKGFRLEEVLFMLNVEISSIYKAEGKVRKIHSLLFVPDFQTMDSLSCKLERIGNIASDGRPILGLDARDLLEIALDTSPDCFVVPAHIWTPWFSVLGSKSGFSSIEECYRDLASQVFAVETGLSSDPAMNYRLSALDRFTLISNSDTHSPSRLGRETNVIRARLDYWSIRKALQTGAITRDNLTKAMVSAAFVGTKSSAQEDDEEFLGTVEFFPEEGKYHLDGHRKCQTRLDPIDTIRLGEKCPVCGRPVTVGVMNRVSQLSDRSPDFIPVRRPPFWRMLPLEEIISQIAGTAPTSKKVQTIYSEVIKTAGPEIPLLCFLPLEELEHRTSPALTEAIKRVRNEELSIKPGYDGEYGIVELFSPGEVARLFGQTGLFELGPVRTRSASTSLLSSDVSGFSAIPTERYVNQSLEWDDSPNDEQKQAIEALDGPILVQAGPGTGKTFTLTQRIVHLLREKKVLPSQIIAVTFTRKAAEELQTRVQATLFGREAACWTGTFHQLGLHILELFAHEGLACLPERILGEDEAANFFQQALMECKLSIPNRDMRRLWDAFKGRDEQRMSRIHLSDIPLVKVVTRYRELLRKNRAADLDELISLPVELLKNHPSIQNRLLASWKHVLVDEFQDVNAAQYELVKLLVGPRGEGLFAIGDPDQAIYGFRGAERSFFFRVPLEWPSCQIFHLTRNYRSQSNILKAAQRALGPHYSNKELVPAYQGSELVKIASCRDSAAEGEYITRTIEYLMGGASFESFNVIGEAGPDRNLGFRDFAVLYRLNAVGDTLEKAFAKSGIPYQRSMRMTAQEETDDLDFQADKISMMTMHASKGLEFSVVFIAGCEEGVIPYIAPDASADDPEQLREEQRLLYVAMTRARHLLYVTFAKKRAMFGRILPGLPCRFLPSSIEPPYERERQKENGRPRRGRMPVQCGLFE